MPRRAHLCSSALFTLGYEKQYSEGDLLFVKRGEHSNMNVVANLPVLNFLLRKTDENGNLEIDSVEKLQKKWNYYGILNNDMDTGSKWQRLFKY